MSMFVVVFVVVAVARTLWVFVVRGAQIERTDEISIRAARALRRRPRRRSEGLF